MGEFKIWLEGGEEKGVYNVPADRMVIINKQLDKVNKRAAKLGLPPVKLVELGRSTKTVEHEDGRKSSREYLKLKVEGEAPKVKGWTFVARIMHSEGENIISSAPGKDPPPAEYRTAEPRCDHCKVNRRRNDTFVLRDDKGEYKQIGRNCLADFLGSTDPADQIALFSDWGSVVQSLGEDDYYGGGGGGGGQNTIEIISYLAGALAVIRKYGFVPKSKSEELGKEATSLVLSDYFFSTSVAANKLRTEVNSVMKPDDGEKAREILDWAKDQKNQTEVSDYLWNISAAAERLVVDIRTAGLVASIPSAYERAMGKKKDEDKKDKAADAPEVTLNPKDKFEGVLTVLKTPRWSNDYGLTVLHIMEDEHGRLYKWKASNEDIDIGSKVLIKGTVKSVGPDSYAGNKITVELTRCKVVKMHMGKEHQAVVGQKDQLLKDWESILGPEMSATYNNWPVDKATISNYVFTKLLEKRLHDIGINYRVWRSNVEGNDSMFFSYKNFENPASAETMIRNLEGMIRELTIKQSTIKQSTDSVEVENMLTQYKEEFNEAIKGLKIFIELIPIYKHLQEIRNKLEGIYNVESKYSGRAIHMESFSDWLTSRGVRFISSRMTGRGVLEKKINLPL